MWRKRNRDPEPDPFTAGLYTGVGDECEAYLAGRMAAYLRDTGRPVPPVAWLNRLVHASSAELALLASGKAVTIEPPAWGRAVGYLARTLLDRAQESGRALVELQRELLVPLELELIGDPDAAQLDSADLIRLTLSRLYEIPELPT